MGIMYVTVRRLYLTGKIDESGLDNAIKKSWITSEEKKKIMAEKA